MANAPYVRKKPTLKQVEAMRPHTFREYDDEWAKAVEAAEHFGEDLSEVLRRALRSYVNLYERTKHQKASTGT